MIRCRGCRVDLEAEDLCRHETAGVVRVHCPDCGRLLGTYNSHHHGE